MDVIYFTLSHKSQFQRNEETISIGFSYTNKINGIGSGSRMKLLRVTTIFEPKFHGYYPIKISQILSLLWKTSQV